MNKAHTYEYLMADLRLMAIEEVYRLGNTTPSEADILAKMNEIKSWPIIKAAFDGLAV